MRTRSLTLERPEAPSEPPAPPSLILAIPPHLEVERDRPPQSIWRRPVVWGPVAGAVVLLVVAAVLLTRGEDKAAPSARPKSKAPMAVAEAAKGQAWEISWTMREPVRTLWVLTGSQPPQDGTTFIRGQKAIVPAALLDADGGCFAASTASRAMESIEQPGAETTDPDGGLTPLTTVPAQTEDLDLEGFQTICTRGQSLEAVRRR